MADTITNTGEQMTREEMIANILRTAQEITATKEKTEEMKKNVTKKIGTFEQMDKGLEVAQMEVEMDEQFAIV